MTTDHDDADEMAPHVGGRLITVVYVEDGIELHAERTPVFVSPRTWAHEGTSYHVVRHSPVTTDVEVIEVQVKRQI